MRTGLQLLQTLVLARLLVPADFGLMAVAASVIAVIWLFSDLGISRALVHYNDVSEDALSSLYWINMGMSLLLMLLVMAAAPFLSSLYGSPALLSLLQIASLAFPLSAAGQQYRALAEKDLRFAALARNEITSSLIGFLAALGVALLDGGVYALVAALLASTASSSLLAFFSLAQGRHPGWRLRLSDARPYLRFGSFLVGEKLAATLQRQADVFIGGWAFGPGALGLYTVPRDLSLRLAMMVNPIITRVGFPVMARARHDPVVLQSIYMQTLRMTASVNFPVYIALALFADEFVALLYGARFEGAGVYLRILAVWGLLRSTGNPVGSLLHAVGATKRAFIWNLALLLLLPPAYLLATRVGDLLTLAWSLVLVQVAIVVPAWRWLVRPCCEVRLGEFLEQLLVPFVLAALAGGLAWLATRVIDTPFLRLAIGAAIGTTAYLLLSARFNTGWLASILELVMPGRQWFGILDRKDSGRGQR